MTNQTAYLTAPCNFEIRASQMPVPKPDDIVVAVEHVGICGSDVLFYNAQKLTKHILNLCDGDKIVITGGVTNGKSGNTNLIKVERV